MSQGPLVTTASLDQSIEALLLGSPMSRGRRLMGVEYERLILETETGKSAPLDFCLDLFRDLAADLQATPELDGELVTKMAGGDFGMSLEPGGQLEVATAPRRCLSEIDEIIERVTAAIEKRLAGSGFQLVCLGHAPVTPVAEIELLPRRRYQVMDASMPRRGALTRNMMRATAGFQTAFDVTGRADAGRKMALLYRLSPVILALTVNSRQVEGRDTGFASFRHKIWFDTDRDRTGIPRGCLHAETAVDGYVGFVRKATALFKLVDGMIEAAPEVPFEQWVESDSVTLEELDLHLSSLFPMVRLRNYLEVRCMDSVEWPLVRSITALLSGIVYCRHATTRAEELSESLVLEDPEELEAFHIEVARVGMDACAPRGMGFRAMVRALIDVAAARLGQPDCTWATAADLETLRRVCA